MVLQAVAPVAAVERRPAARPEEMAQMAQAVSLGWALLLEVTSRTLTGSLSLAALAASVALAQAAVAAAAVAVAPITATRMAARAEAEALEVVAVAAAKVVSLAEHPSRSL
jgi:hypothetical protein